MAFYSEFQEDMVHFFAVPGLSFSLDEADHLFACFFQLRRAFHHIYDNIIGGDRMSLYVEIGHPKDAMIDEAAVDATRARVIEDLRRAGIVTDHRLVSSHSVVMDPAYVHVTRASLADFAAKRRILESRGVYSIGRYGGWTYCSIEDNVVEARALADTLVVPWRAS